MRKFQWLIVVLLIGGIVSFASCKRMEQMMTPMMPDAEQVEPPEPTEMPPEMMPMDEGIGIFDTNVMPGHGLIAEAFYPGGKLTMLPDFDTLTPFRTWMVANIDVPLREYTQGFPELGVDVLEDFAIRLRGQLKVETAGDYNFKIQSDDGAQVYINEELIVDNDGLQPFTIKHGSAMLAAGFHDLEIRYFQGPRTHIGLQWSWQPPGGVEAIVPPEVLYPPGTGEVSVEPTVETAQESPVQMYWLAHFARAVQRANLDGSNVQDLVTGLVFPQQIALDTTAGKMYWTDSTTSKIQRANLDGSNVQDLVTTDISEPWGLALDIAGGKMYWTDAAMAKIQRANLDGSNVETLATELINPAGIALDVAGGKMYWTVYRVGEIQRANLDGSNVETLISTGLGAPLSIALDIAGGKMYWTEVEAAKIQQANLDGSDIQTVIDTGAIGAGIPHSIALDVASGKLYWTDWTTRKIRRANLDGSGGVEELLSGLRNPLGIALSLP